MKKSLLILGLAITSFTAVQAQCTITPGCTPTSGYCSTPTAGNALPNAAEQAAYSTIIQVSLSTTFSGATINNATITSVTGLPTGLSYSTNPTSGVINGGSDGCILIAGTPAASTAGSYSVTANVTLNTNFGAFPTTLVWALTVDAAAGIATSSADHGTLFLTPNPAFSQVNLSANFYFQKARIFDALGNLVMTHDAINSSKVSIDLSRLSPGIYFVQISDGNKSAIRKFIKE